MQNNLDIKYAIEVLDEFDINKSYYDFSSQKEESYFFEIIEDGKCKICLIERGQKRKEKEFSNTKQACLYLFDKLANTKKQYRQMEKSFLLKLNINLKFDIGDVVKINDGHIIVENNGAIVEIVDYVVSFFNPYIDYPLGYVIAYYVMINTSSGHSYRLPVMEECLIPISISPKGVNFIPYIENTIEKALIKGRNDKYKKNKSNNINNDWRKK